MRRFLCSVLIAAALGAVACSPSTVRPVRQGPTDVKPLVPTPVSDDQFGEAVHTIMVDGSASPERTALLAGVVRRQFARAAQRFDSGDSTRGLASLTGALYLVRAGELRQEMFDQSSARAFAKALEVVAPAGDEGRSLAFMRLQSASLPKNSPEQAQIAEHMRALTSWLKDTRRWSDVENAGLDQRAFGERASVEPTAESLNEARVATEKWLSAAMEFHSEFRPGIDRVKREQLSEAYRGVRTGALVLAALYLRHGDAAGANQALEKSAVRRAAPAALIERLETAANGSDPLAWRELSALYARASATASEDQFPIAPEIARGAAWGSAVEAYRRNPTAIETAVPLAEMLSDFGMSEGGAALVVDSAREVKNATSLGACMAISLKLLMSEDQSHDLPNARRVFQTIQPIIAAASALPAQARPEPTPAQVRFVMASIETRSGELAAAKALLEKVVADQPSAHAYELLASLLLQTGDTQGALQAVVKATSAPDAAQNPLARSEANLVAFRAHRDAGRVEQARSAISAALRDAIEARTASPRPGPRAGAERMLMRIAFHYGDRAAIARTVARAFETAGPDKRLAGMIAIEAAAAALLTGDLKAGRAALTRSMDLGIDDDDLIYTALWVDFLERSKKATGDDSVRKAYRSVNRGPGWTSQLAHWAEGKIDDAALLARARDNSQRTEAGFYVALRRWASGDSSANAEFARIAKSHALQLVEVHLAREMSAQPLALGAAPMPIP